MTRTYGDGVAVDGHVTDAQADVLHGAAVRARRRYAAVNISERQPDGQMIVRGRRGAEIARIAVDRHYDGTAESADWQAL